jgi:hypothetical protein
VTIARSDTLPKIPARQVSDGQAALFWLGAFLGVNGLDLQQELADAAVILALCQHVDMTVGLQWH